VVIHHANDFVVHQPPPRRLPDSLWSGAVPTAGSATTSTRSTASGSAGNTRRTPAPVDILAISKDKRELLVVELKKGRVSDVVTLPMALAATEHESGVVGGTQASR
jgi:hypothetical protein